MVSKKLCLAAGAAMALMLGANAAQAEMIGVTDTEIKIGGTHPYSGPASAYGTIGTAIKAYFKMINDHGGINGRMLNYVDLDDGYSPPKTVEQVRKLVEQEQVAFLFNTLGTPTNTAIHKYVNAKKVPHLFVATGASKWGDPKHFPWSMGWQPTYPGESKIYAAYILKNKPDAKIAILYQNDDYGKDYLNGFLEGLGDKAKTMIVAQEPYEVTDPTIDSQIIKLQNSGADTFFNISTPKFAAQAIRKAHDTGWKPLHFLNNVSASVGSVLKPAGLDKSKDLITTQYFKDPTDPQFQGDDDYKAWVAWMDEYYAGGDKTNSFNVYGYIVASGLVEVLKKAGNDLSRENIMKTAASLHEMSLPMLLSGVKVNTSADDFYPIECEQLVKFTGDRWELFGEVICPAHEMK